MRLLYFNLIVIIIVFISCGSNNKVKMVKKLNGYSSASAIEYFNGQYFVMGDDSRNLLILDNNLIPLDSIRLYESPEIRIPKNIKGDIESMTITRDNKLLLLGSGSLNPYRNNGWLIDPASKHVDSIPLDTIYNRLKEAGLKLNIEGVCSIPGFIIMANRGNKSWRRNDLILVNEEFWKEQDTTTISFIHIITDTNTVFTGVSGLAYATHSDQLVLTMSTENTTNNFDDGTIGKSYLWFVKNISSKRGLQTLIPDRIIDLEELDSRFSGQKIESVCITEEASNFMLLTLAADNDDGSSAIFMISISL